MNYFAHALPFLDNPYLMAGTGVPDWLSVIDRQVRVRPKNVRPLLADDDPQTAAVARGVLQHLCDDQKFHRTRAFTETSLELSVVFRGVLGPEAGFRASFLGHLLTEVLLDAALAIDHSRELETYYRVLEGVDFARVQEVVNRTATRPTRRLAPMIFLFWRERILWDYLEDDKLFLRMNQVMRRVGFERLPDDLVSLLPSARQKVYDRRRELLEGLPAAVPETELT